MSNIDPKKNHALLMLALSQSKNVSPEQAACGMISVTRELLTAVHAFGEIGPAVFANAIALCSEKEPELAWVLKNVSVRIAEAIAQAYALEQFGEQHGQPLRQFQMCYCPCAHHVAMREAIQGGEKARGEKAHSE